MGNITFPSEEWTNGSWTLRWLTEDEIEIIGPYTGQRAVLCGGDFEGILSALCAASSNAKQDGWREARKQLLGSGHCA